MSLHQNSTFSQHKIPIAPLSIPARANVRRHRSESATSSSTLCTLHPLSWLGKRSSLPSLSSLFPPFSLCKKEKKYWLWDGKLHHPSDRAEHITHSCTLLNFHFELLLFFLLSRMHFSTLPQSRTKALLAAASICSALPVCVEWGFPTHPLCFGVWVNVLGFRCTLEKPATNRDNSS